LYRDRRTRAVNGFAGRKGAADEIKSQCHETCDFGHEMPALRPSPDVQPIGRMTEPMALVPTNSVRHPTSKENAGYAGFLRQIRVLVVAAAGLSGSLAMAADPDHGSDLAKRWCAACYVVDSDQKQQARRAGPSWRLICPIAVPADRPNSRFADDPGNTRLRWSGLINPRLSVVGCRHQDTLRRAAPAP
jgi:hypothetical protein